MQSTDGSRRIVPRYAGRVENAVFEACDIFCRHPQFGVPTDESDVHRWPIDEFGYTIFYRVNRQEDAIEVLRVIDGRRLRDLRRVPR
jgi:plasmid stabilization system protein ParE